MSEEKKNANPFVALAKKATQQHIHNGKTPVITGNISKPSRGARKPSVVRRSGRGG